MNTVLKAIVAACGISIVIACSADSGAQGDESSERWGSDESAAESDRPAAGGPSASGSVPIDITAELGGKAYRSRGEGKCTYAEQAYIRGVPSSMWQVQYRGRDEGILTRA